MKVYIIVGWLNGGITTDEVQKSNYSSLVKSVTKNKWYGSGQWFLTYNEAYEKIESLRLRQIKTIEKRLIKLNEYKLSIHEL